MATYLVKRTTRLSATPHSIAAGVACGVAISFTPFIGLHLVGSFLLCLLVRGNYVAAAVGTLVGNPWTFPLLWLATYQLGRVMLGGPATPIEAFHHWDLATLLAKMEAVFWPMAVGSIPLAVIGGLATYFLLMPVIAAYQEARRGRRAQRRQDRLGLKSQGARSDLGVS
jgi:uncharacterized protein (DUF2062 family)